MNCNTTHYRANSSSVPGDPTGASVVHRDLKPSNVLVTPEGRVVLLDFGVAHHVLHGRDQEVCGTLAFMSEEQRHGESEPASDMYAVGVMLDLALTGSLDPRASVDLPVGAAPWLELAERLRNPKPSDRPDVQTLLAWLTGTNTQTRSAARPAGAKLARQDELLDLTRAASEERAEPKLIWVEGASGMGKSVLREHLAQSLVSTEVGAHVLDGRCSRREAVRYRAIDPMIDALSALWKHLPESEAIALLPDGIAALCSLFPVLLRVRAVARAVENEAPIADARERRRVAVVALRQVLRALAQARPLVLFTDDAQWLDEDSLALLVELTSMPHAPALTVVAFSRPEAATFTTLRGHFSLVQHLTLEPLRDHQAMHLLRELAPHASSHWARAINLAEGNPFLLSQLGQVLQTERALGDALELSALLEKRLDALGALPRRVLEMIALSVEPLDVDRIPELVSASHVEVTRALGLLEAQHYVRSTTLQPSAREPYHDRVTEFVESKLRGTARAQYHLALAESLEAHEARRAGDASRVASALLLHFRHAGKYDRAFSYARLAADQAAARLAFHDAAALYATCLELAPEHSDVPALMALRADMLAYAGLDRQAAAQLHELATRCDDPRERFELMRREGELLLRGGFAAEGLARLSALLGDFNMRMPTTHAGSVLSFLKQRAQIALRGYSYEARSEDESDPHALARVDLCLTIGLGAGISHPMLGLDFASRSTLHALRCGEPKRLARALLGDAVLNALSTRPDKYERSLALARELIAGRDDPLLDARLSFATAQCALYRLDTARAHTEILVALKLLTTRCRGVSAELAVARNFLFTIRLFRADSTLEPDVAEALRDALMRNDVMSEFSYRMALAVLRLMADDVASCRREIDTAIDCWTGKGFDTPRWSHALGQAQLYLYEGRASEALSLLETVLQNARKCGLLLAPVVRVFTYYSVGVAASNVGTAHGRKTVERCYRKLRAEPFPMAEALSQQLLAWLKAQDGKASEAAVLCDDAARAFDLLRAPLYARASRTYRDQLLHQPAQVEGGSDNTTLACAERYLSWHGPMVRQASS